MAASVNKKQGFQFYLILIVLNLNSYMWLVVLVATILASKTLETRL